MGADDSASGPNDEANEQVEYPIDGELDLHAFKPSEVASLVEEYVLTCRERGVLALRIVHGKGRGALRRTVHAVLERMGEHVERYALAPAERGGWGATLVDLRPGPFARPPEDL